MPTLRLYWDDSLRLAFEETVTGHAAAGERPALLLRATCFYPEAGGQLADRGRIRWDGGEAALVDAQEDGQGEVLHLLELPPGAVLPPAGARVSIEIDEARRRAHMSQHTGQHLLSRALLDRAGAETSSSRLGELSCTIDTPLARLSESAVAEAEALACAVVLEDRPVRALRPDPVALAAMKLRRDPKVESDVRVIDLDGFDLSPCGGTHCRRTGEVGPVKVTSIERYKGGHRITFRTGARAISDSVAKERLLAGLSRELTCAPEDVPAAVAKLRGSLRAELAAGTVLRERLALLLSEQLLATVVPRGTPPIRFVRVVLPGESLELLRLLAARLTAAPDVACLLLAPAEDGTRAVVQRGSGTGLDAGALMRRVAAVTGGRGGGRPDRAEGQLPPGAELEAALAAAADGT